jgi:peptide/nickel transport system permease protein
MKLINHPQSKVIYSNTNLLIGSIIVFFFAFLAIFAKLIPTKDPNNQDLANTLQGPSASHLFGTDALGRDVLSRVINGSAIELQVVVPAVLISLLISLPAGMIAGYLGGWFDRFIGWISDSILTFPAMVLAIVFVAIFGSGIPTLILAIFTTQAPQMIRYVRGFTNQVKNADYVLASRSSGSSLWTVLIKHIVPNILGPIMVIASLFASEALLIIAALGFLGIGVQPPAPEWGTMLSEGRVDFLYAPHVMLFPGAAIALLILGFNLLGDGLRDYLDKRN